MRLTIALPFLVMVVIGLELSSEKANAELSPNNAFVMEGSGFAITDEFIQNSQIDLLFTTGDQVGSSIKLLVEDGFVSLNDEDFTITDPRQRPRKEYNHPPDSVMALIYSIAALKNETEWHWVSG